MNVIRVYSVGSHESPDHKSGVDYVRVYSPMKYLNGYKDDDVEIQVTQYDINKKPQDNWIDIAKEYDVVFLNYSVLAEAYAYMGAPVHGNGRTIIMDIDDAVWFVQKDNIVHDKLKEMNAEYILTCILNDVDGIVTTNRYLRNIIGDKTYKQHKDIRVIENQIDLTLYNQTFPPEDRDQITLMHFGSTSHFDDLLDEEFVNGMDRILKEFPNVRFKTIGAFISKLRYKWGSRYVNDFGDVDIYRWIKDKFPVFMEEADIMVVPLLDTKYNRSKSDIKFLESGSAMKPGIYSAVRPYTDTIVHGETGYLANTSDEWYEYMKLLITDLKERRRIGKNAYEYIKKERQIQDHVKEYTDFIKYKLDIL